MRRTRLNVNYKTATRGLAVTAGLLLVTATAWSRTQGIMATSCTGCHGGADMSEVSLRFEPDVVEPGGTATMVIEINADNAAAAGVAILGRGVGSFSVSPEQPLVVSGDWVLHDQPKAAEGGMVEFRVDWTAPAEIGVASFDVAVLATNGNRQASGDRPGGASVTIGHGCEPVTVYWDSDSDGFGRADAWMVACGPDEVYVETPGDCGDSDPERFPGAEERCNGLDDDCDGEVDEGVENGAFYLDFDEDGFGDPAMLVETCSPEGGYVDNGLDCNDRSAANNPGATEICDYVDNDCDGDIDEDLRPTCGVGLCRRVSELCDSTSGCSPGAPLEEGCNGLDDDCDGETDEEGCPVGQACLGNQCVPSEDVPVDTAPLPSSDLSSTAVETRPMPSTGVSDAPAVPSPSGTTAPGPSPSSAAPNSEAGSVPPEAGTSAEGCSCVVGRDGRSARLLWLMMMLIGAGAMVARRRQRNTLAQRQHEATSF